MTTLFQKLRNRVRDTVTALRSGPSYRIVRATELPDSLKGRTLYLLGIPEPWSAALLCPCGCEELIQISLLDNDSPSWRLRLNKRDQPTLDPSIWRKHGCRSHFFLREGRIVWYRRL